MTAKLSRNVKAEARAKLAHLQKSAKHHSFFNVAAIDVFTKDEGSAFAGKSLKDVSEQS